MAKKTTAQIKKEMAANSAAWHSAPSGSATTKGTKEWYAAQNQTLGKQIGGSYNSASGTWSDSSGNALYSGSGGGTSGGYSGGSSGGGSSSNYSQYTKPTLGDTWDANTDYQAIINQAVGAGDYVTAAKAEQLRNQKIIFTGSNYDRTNNYSQYLPDYGTIGLGQVYNNAYYGDVEDTLNLRTDKALYTPGLEQYAKDDTYWTMYNYIQAKKNEEEINKIRAEYEQLAQDRPEDYQRPYDPAIDALLNEILNRKDFSYDVMNDPLYQQYAQMYQREGDRAMRETLAEVAASAGGMNSYAITAASQANNYYSSQLTDKIPELYQLAYDMYINEKESKVQDLGILQNMDATQYNRYRDTINDYYNDKNFAYGVYQDAVQQGNWQATFDNNNYWANKEFDNTNFWKEKEFNANQGQIDLENSRYDKEKAREEIEWYIKNGVTTISPDLIKRAELDQTAVNQMIAAYQAELLANQKKTKNVGGNVSLADAWAKKLNTNITNKYGNNFTALIPNGDGTYSKGNVEADYIILQIMNSPDLTDAEQSELLNAFGITDDQINTVLKDSHYR